MTPPQPGHRSAYVPVLGIHDVDTESDNVNTREMHVETNDQIVTISYDPEDATEHDVTHVVDERISPGESPGPDTTPQP